MRLRYVVPYLRPFPIWTFGPLYGRLDGDYLGEGWSPNWFGEWRFATEEEARAAVSSGGT